MARNTAPKDRLLEAEAWVFDLDNTLYPASSNLFAQIDQKMTRFIADFLDLDRDEANRLRKNYFREHGTTMRGMMDRHAMEPGDFLDYVHDIDLGSIAPDPALDEALGRIPGRKIIFTNGPRAHARRVMERLAIGHHFEAVFDIIEADYIPKPEPQAYEALIRRHRLQPGKSVMVEDLARNLAPAASLGMTTVWVRSENDWDREPTGGECVHHVVDDLVQWLGELTAERTVRAQAP